MRVASGISIQNRIHAEVSVLNSAQRSFVRDTSLPVAFPSHLNDGDRMGLVVDVDGTLTGRPPVNGKNAIVVNNSTHLKTKNCVALRPAGSNVCPDHFAKFGVSFTTLPPVQQEVIAYLHRDDQANQPLKLCGGRCQETSEPFYAEGGRRLTFTSIVVGRDYTYHFQYTPPVNVSVSMIDFKNPRSTTGFEEIRVGFCYPPGTTVKQVTWNFSKNRTAATSLADMKTRDPQLQLLGQRGQGMWFHDTTSGYVYIRMIRDTNFSGSIVAFEVILPGGWSGKPTCIPNTAVEGADEPLPPVNRAAVPKITANPISAVIKPIPRGVEGQCP